MSSVQATDFPRFLELPFEIRWTVYELCLPTRGIDSEICDLEPLPKEFAIPEERLALTHIVAKFCRTPVTAKASPEVYRDLRRHVVAPPKGGWVWSWQDRGTEGFTDNRPVIFNPRSDVVCVSLDARNLRQDSDKYLNSSPYCLASSLDTAVAIDGYAIDCLRRWKSLSNYCFLGRKRCILILNETRLVKPAEWIASCGLFGLFGEERTVLVDVDDLDRVDYFDKKLNGHGQDICRSNEFGSTLTPDFWLGGLRRYSSHGTVHFKTAWCETSPVVSAEQRAEIIAKDKKEMIRRVRRSWLEANGYFKGTKMDNPDFVPPKDESWDIASNEEHPDAKPWYDKLPAFSFAVRVHAQDLKEETRLRDAWKARNRYQRREDKFLEKYFGV